MSEEHTCWSCGHATHHCTTVGQCCSVVTIDATGSHMCMCPSTAPASSRCACEGRMPWFRNHWDSSCDQDYPTHDPNCCDGEVKFTDGTSMRCSKRIRHRGPHSGHNDCGVRDVNGQWICGSAADFDGLCEKHQDWKSIG